MIWLRGMGGLWGDVIVMGDVGFQWKWLWFACFVSFFICMIKTGTQTKWCCYYLQKVLTYMNLLVAYVSTLLSLWRLSLLVYITLSVRTKSFIQTLLFLKCMIFIQPPIICFWDLTYLPGFKKLHAVLSPSYCDSIICDFQKLWHYWNDVCVHMFQNNYVIF